MGGETESKGDELGIMSMGGGGGIRLVQEEPPEISPGTMWDGVWGEDGAVPDQSEDGASSVGRKLPHASSMSLIMGPRTTHDDSTSYLDRALPRRPTDNDLHRQLLPHEGGKVTTDWRPRITKNGFGTVMGVFVPSLLSIIGVVLFLRLGWAVGQAGMMCTLLMFAIGGLMAYLTILSVSALATNGRVAGGGAYYLLSRSVGPELGGAIGMVFTAANICGISFYMQGFTDTLTMKIEDWNSDALENHWAKAGVGIGMLFLESLICIFSPSLYPRCILLLLLVQIVAQVFGNAGLLFHEPQEWTGQKSSIDSKLDNMTFVYTGPTWDTFHSNLWPDFDENGSFSIVFGIVFPAMTGIMAGANMSGVLKRPDIAIPRGALSALTAALFGYVLMIFSLGCSVERDTLKNDYFILSRTSWAPNVITFGVITSSASSALASIQSASRLLQAVANDDLIPVINPFKKMWKGEPALAIVVSVFVASVLLCVGSFDVLAPILTMFTLITYATTNFATFLYTIAGAPNFRPRFRFFSWFTALFGGVICISIMFYIQWSATLVATCVIGILTFYIGKAMDTEGKGWGDVTQALIFHQVRKYLLRLGQTEHIKFWRARFLLLADSPQNKVQMFEFMNDMKKGGLLIIGDPIVDEREGCDVKEGLLQQVEVRRTKWQEFIEEVKLKAFVNCSHAATHRAAARSLLTQSGIGGMRPNCVVAELTPNDADEVRAPVNSVALSPVHGTNTAEVDFEIADSDDEDPKMGRLHSYADGFTKRNSAAPHKKNGKRRFIKSAGNWHHVPFENPHNYFATEDVPSPHSVDPLPPTSPFGTEFKKPKRSDKELLEILGDADELKMSFLLLANFDELDISSVMEKHELHKALLSSKGDKRFAKKMRIDVWECPWGAPEDFTLAVQLADMLMRQDRWEKVAYIRICSFVEQDDDTLQRTKARYSSLHSRVIRKMRVPATIQVWGLDPGTWNENLKTEAEQLAIYRHAQESAIAAVVSILELCMMEDEVETVEVQGPHGGARRLSVHCVSPSPIAETCHGNDAGGMDTLLTHLPSAKRLNILHDLVKDKNHYTAVTFMPMPGMPPRSQAGQLGEQYMATLRYGEILRKSASP